MAPHRIDRAVAKPQVGVEDEYRSARREVGTRSIDAACETQVAARFDQDDVIVRGDDFGGVVGRFVVDNDYSESGRIGMRAQITDQVAHVPGAVVGDDHYRDIRMDSRGNESRHVTYPLPRTGSPTCAPPDHARSLRMVPMRQVRVVMRIRWTTCSPRAILVVRLKRVGVTRSGCRLRFTADAPHLLVV